MRVKKTVLLLGMFVCFSGFAQTPKKVFLQANKLYTQKKYKNALELYGSVNEEGKKYAPAVWYNMGNCAYRLGNYAQAIVYWSKSKKGAFLSQLSSIDYNIVLAHEALGVSPINTLWEKTKDIIGLFSLLLLQLMFLLIWFLSFILFFLAKKVSGLLLRILLWANIGFTILFGAALGVKYYTLAYRQAIVKTETSLFVGPNQQYDQIGKLSVADKVMVQKVDKKWYKITYNGVTGWVLSDNVEVM